MILRDGVAILAAAAAVLGIAAIYTRRLRCNKRSWPTGVAVRASLVSGAGDGLFALRTFSRGECMGEYRGKVLSLIARLKRDDHDYTMGFGLNTYVDATDSLDAAGRYVNHHFDAAKINARFRRVPGEKFAELLAARDISAGEEIHASYGDEYWIARGVCPRTGLPAPPPDAETAEDLRVLRELKARARAPGPRGPLCRQ
jgi:hypothetical protein